MAYHHALAGCLDPGFWNNHLEVELILENLLDLIGAPRAVSQPPFWVQMNIPICCEDDTNLYINCHNNKHLQLQIFVESPLHRVENPTERECKSTLFLKFCARGTGWLKLPVDTYYT